MTDKEKEAHEAYVWNVLRERAHSRAELSDDPEKFMKIFRTTLQALHEGGDSRRIEHGALWSSSVLEAAEIEALCAHRALQHWGTGHGLCVSLWRKKLLHAG